MIKKQTLLFIFFIAALFFGCSGRSGSVFKPNLEPLIIVPPPKPLEKKIWSEVSRWQGVPYRYGGNSFKGIDCSGFTTAVYRNLFNIHLPRTAHEQSKVGQSVPRKKLRAGDLIFFKNANRSRHVGIYLWEEKFAHASQKKGKIIISHMKNPYWKRVYWTARRIY